MNKDLTSLDGTLETVWQRLNDGVDRPDAPARHLALATARVDGGGSVRTVVLRAANRDAATLTFFTHRASSKVTELTKEPRCEAVIWDAKSDLQIRLRMTAELSAGPEDVWNRFGPGTRRNYALSQLPGAPLEVPEELEPATDPSQFMVISAKIEVIETLHLGRDLHRRARFIAGKSNWIAP